MNRISEIDHKLSKLMEQFKVILYEDDVIFMENMKTKNLAGDDINKYRFWEWPQGVGLYGIWKMFQETKDQALLHILIDYYDRQLEVGLPALNVNTVVPLLAMACLAEEINQETYMTQCRQAAEWIMTSFPRTKEGGFQHITSDTLNDQELWDDTLFMTVLFLAKMGQILDKQSYIDEAIYQLLLHVKYLQNKESGLFYHGWTFNGDHNFAGVFWGRGNCWITMVIPEFLNMIPVSEAVERYLVAALKKQVDSLIQYQNSNGMWHTIIDDATSYVEASATCGFGYGILSGVRYGYLEPTYIACAEKALQPIMDYIDEDGVLNQVSYGTAMGREGIDFYKEIPIMPMPYGQAMAMLFLDEYKRRESLVY